MLGTTELIIKVKKNFLDTARPEGPARSDQNRDKYDATSAFWGKSYLELSLRSFDESIYAFTSLPKSSFAYYFGAYLWHAVKDGRFDSDSFRYLLPISEGRRKREAVDGLCTLPFRLAFDQAQLETFCDFLEYASARVSNDDAKSYLRLRELLIKHIGDGGVRAPFPPRGR